MYVLIIHNVLHTTQIVCPKLPVSLPMLRIEHASTKTSLYMSLQTKHKMYLTLGKASSGEEIITILSGTFYGVLVYYT